MARRGKGFWVGDEVFVRPLRARGKRGPDDGRLYWQASIGRQRDRSTRKIGWATREEAQRLAAQMVAEGVSAPGSDVVSITTMQDLLEYWVGHELDRTELAPGTRAMRQQHGSHLARTIGRIRIGDDTAVRSAAEEHRRARRAAGAAPSTIRVELGSLHQAWRYGRRLGLVAGDGPERVRWTKREREHRVVTDRTPTYAEAVAVYQHLRQRQTAWPAAHYLVMWETGCRPGESEALRGCDVLFADRLIRLDGKTGERWFPATDELLEVLRPFAEARAPELRLWPVARSSMRRFGPDYLDPACAAAKVQRFTPYGLRRAMVDRLYRNGVSPDVAAALSGHSPEMALRMYRQVTAADRRAAARRVAASLQSGQVVAFPGSGGGSDGS